MHLLVSHEKSVENGKVQLKIALVPLRILFEAPEDMSISTSCPALGILFVWPACGASCLLNGIQSAFRAIATGWNVGLSEETYAH